jgi:hypothetical protein
MKVILPGAGSLGLRQEVTSWRAPVLVLIPICIPWINVSVIWEKLCQSLSPAPSSELGTLRMRFPSFDNFKLVEFTDEVLVVHIVTAMDPKLPFTLVYTKQ